MVGKSYQCTFYVHQRLTVFQHSITTTMAVYGYSSQRWQTRRPLAHHTFRLRALSFLPLPAHPLHYRREPSPPPQPTSTTHHLLPLEIDTSTASILAVRFVTNANILWQAHQRHEHPSLTKVSHPDLLTRIRLSPGSVSSWLWSPSFRLVSISLSVVRPPSEFGP